MMDLFQGWWDFGTSQADSRDGPGQVIQVSHEVRNKPHCKMATSKSWSRMKRAIAAELYKRSRSGRYVPR